MIMHITNEEIEKILFGILGLAVACRLESDDNIDEAVKFNRKTKDKTDLTVMAYYLNSVSYGSSLGERTKILEFAVSLMADRKNFDFNVCRKYFRENKESIINICKVGINFLKTGYHTT